MTSTPDSHLHALPILHETLDFFLSFFLSLNGKMPMAEFVAAFLHEVGVPPLVLTRLCWLVMKPEVLQRHFEQTSAKIGVGTIRGGVPKSIIERYGHMDPCDLMQFDKISCSHKSGPGSKNGKVGAIILDDGMQTA